MTGWTMFSYTLLSVRRRDGLEGRAAGCSVLHASAYLARSFWWHFGHSGKGGKEATKSYVCRYSSSCLARARRWCWRSWYFSGLFCWPDDQPAGWRCEFCPCYIVAFFFDFLDDLRVFSQAQLRSLKIPPGYSTRWARCGPAPRFGAHLCVLAPSPALLSLLTDSMIYVSCYFCGWRD